MVFQVFTAYCCGMSLLFFLIYMTIGRKLEAKRVEIVENERKLIEIEAKDQNGDTEMKTNYGSQVTIDT